MLLSAIDGWLAPAPDPARVAWLRRHEYAHRGVHDAQVPENSPAAFAEAIRRGRVKDALEGVVALLRRWDFQPAAITHSGNDVSRDDDS